MKLPAKLRDALTECVAHDDRGNNYWWRPASMKKLRDIGLVEAWYPNGSGGKVAHRPTAAGRAALRDGNGGGDR